MSCSEDKLDVQSQVEDYVADVKKNPDFKMIDLKEFGKNLKFDIRYATKNNFTKTIIYPEAEAFARKPVAEALIKANDSLLKLGYRIKVFDAYRPYQATVKFYEVYPDTDFVADPKFGSRHNRGCAIDLTLVDAKTGLEIKMPTTYDDFTEKAHPDYVDLPEEIIKNRDLLIEVMTNFGFSVYPSEWWHFDYQGWERYPLMDLSFEELQKTKKLK
ncbi:D-alanyl-D-alanine dipeptidase [Psychroflexus planctonicus]|uniref:D-alanyl-D-alanine dipeptidase n=2 Tax=Psychroflexus planctonicus TaxID=1526575 RepID=A0ABQ1SFS5_9FLAO|nr:D-alanyl-D-alanine dipeptidase [Psychroflexus planctonicus]